MSKSIQFKKQNENIYPHPYYPVGSIYLSVVNTNPSTWFGGTWEQIAKGRTLVGVDTNDTDFNTVEKIGGEKTHVLTASELPADPKYWSYAGGNIDWPLVSGVGLGAQTYCEHYVNVGGSTGAGNISVYAMKSSGARNPAQHDVAHNNIQPYFTCYIWCRTA